METLERPALKPVPATPFEFAEWKKARVNIDYHIQVDRHLYSVPYPLVRQEVDVRLTATAVEILHNGKRVAAHRRDRRLGAFTTDPGHRPKAHQQHLDWTPSRLIHWGQSIGAATGELVDTILTSKPHPEHGYPACLGLFSLARRYSRERLDAACGRALRSGTPHYRSVKSILEHGLDRLSLENEPPPAAPAAYARPCARPGHWESDPRSMRRYSRQTALDLVDARRIVAEFVAYYNTVRLHSAIRYVPPQAKLERQEILAVRDQRLAPARDRRRQRRASERNQSIRMAG